MSGPVQTPVTAAPCKRSPGYRSRLWRAKAMKVAVLLVNGYFLLGMGDCNTTTNGPLFSAPTGPTLSALTLSAWLLNPSFDPDVTSYDTMFIGDTSVTITPTAAEAGTTITINSSPVTSGNTSGAIALPSGNTTITIILTANGLTSTYTITAHRLGQQAYVKASNTGAGDQLGFSVALDVNVGGRSTRRGGKWVGVNPTPNNLTSQAGAAYVFVRNGTIWTQQAYLKASNTGAGDLFGYSVVLTGDTLAVGAPFEDGSATGVNGADDDGTTDSGAVYVFVRNGTTWTQQAYIKASNTGNDDVFGGSLALSGDFLVVGATQEDGSGTGVNPTSDNLASNAGAAYVFVRERDDMGPAGLPQSLQYG